MEHRCTPPPPAPALRRRTAPRKAVRGQALIWLLGTLSASAAVMYGVYNVGQLNANKAKTVNAADAAALAGATVQARLLNLMAYNNRALMANEAFLVQILSMESWLGYFSTTATNIGTALSIAGTVIPPLQAAAQVLSRTARLANSARTGVTQISDSVVVALEVAKRTIATAHGVVRVGGGLLAEDVAARVVGMNRTTFGNRIDAGPELDGRPAVRAVTVLPNQVEWAAFTRRYEADQRQEARQVLLASRDDFSASRPGADWMNISVSCLGGAEKRGGSRLVNFDRWETQDTFEVWRRRRLCSKRWTPVGWGRANAAQERNSGAIWNPRRSAQWRARQDGARNGHAHRGWSGVPAVYDISDKRSQSRASLGVDFFVAVRRPEANAMTSQRLGMGLGHEAAVGSSEMDERLAGNQMSAVSKARVFFERPSRGSNDFTAASLWRTDGAKEYGSLFSPYWQARLTELSTNEKRVLVAAMGLNPLLAGVTPGGR